MGMLFFPDESDDITTGLPFKDESSFHAEFSVLTQEADRRVPVRPADTFEECFNVFGCHNIIRGNRITRTRRIPQRAVSFLFHFDLLSARGRALTLCRE